MLAGARQVAPAELLMERQLGSRGDRVFAAHRRHRSKWQLLVQLRKNAYDAG
jgi:hypothetical protein